MLRLLSAKEYNLLLIEINRYSITFIWILSLISIVCIFIGILKNNKAIINIINYIITLMLSISIFYITPQILQYTQEFIGFGETALSTMVLIRWVGFLLGLILGIIILISSRYISFQMTEKTMQIFFLLIMFIYSSGYFTKAISALYRLHIIPMNDLIFDILIFQDKYYVIFTYIIFTIAILFSLFTIIKNIKVNGTFSNNAMFRKAKAKTIYRRRLGYLLTTMSIIVIFILSYVNYIDTKEVELAKPQPYQIEENKIVIPLKDVNDGKLHRFEYKTPNGYNVKFLAVKKPAGNAYGLGLDACDICGLAGYYEKGDDVICKRCDVVMNKNTIGFKGGCNPVPFPYVIANKKIYIEKSALEKEEDRFK